MFDYYYTFGFIDVIGVCLLLVFLLPVLFVFAYLSCCFRVPGFGFWVDLTAVYVLLTAVWDLRVVSGLVVWCLLLGVLGMLFVYLLWLNFGVYLLLFGLWYCFTWLRPGWIDLLFGLTDFGFFVVSVCMVCFMSLVFLDLFVYVVFNCFGFTLVSVVYVVLRMGWMVAALLWFVV